jgi:vitamin B12 transporter
MCRIRMTLFMFECNRVSLWIVESIGRVRFPLSDVPDAMTMIYRLIAAIGVACIAHGYARAQLPLPAARERLDVFAERAPMLRTDGVQSISVIGREEIDRRNASSVVDLLRAVAGLHVDRLGNASGIANVYIRGAEPNHTIVLVDGVRMNDPTDVRGGSYDLSTLAIEEVERIEVLRGASSAQFGADAMGGVVNIVTRRGRPAARASAVMGAGSHAYRKGAARVSTGGFAAGVTHDEDGSREDGGTNRLRTGDASLEIIPATGHAISLSARAARRESEGFPESSGGVRLATNRAFERRDVEEKHVAFNYRAGAEGRVQWNAKVAISEREEDRDTPAAGPGPGGFVPALQGRSEFRRSGFAVIGAHTFADAYLGSAGIEAWRETGRRDSMLRIGPGLRSAFDLDRDTRAIFAQLEARPTEALLATLAARHDDIDPGGSRTSRMAGVRWQISPASIVRAQLSEGFKPPSFFALGDALVGNPDLKAERSRAAEVAFEHAWTQTMRAQATLFRTRFEDLVDFDPALFRMVNRANATIEGAELEAGLRRGALDARFTYTYVDARLGDGESRLRNRPRHRASATLAYAATHSLSLSTTLAHVGRTFDFSIPTGEIALPGYTTLDVAATWRHDRWRASIAIDNATDRRHEAFVGFTAPGARLRASVGFEL